MLRFISNNNDKPDENHRAALLNAFAGADTIAMCSGHLKLGGVEELAAALQAAVGRGARITFYSNKGDTHLAAARALTELGIEHIVVKGFYLHTKLYFFETGNNYSALIGSANITRNALTSNEEFSVSIDGNKGDQQHVEITTYLEQLDRRCRDSQAKRKEKRRRAQIA